jgi:hypothetical protein
MARQGLPPADTRVDGDTVDLEAREDLASEDVPEVDAASEDLALERDVEAHATEDIVGDTDGDDYRAGTLDPEGSDRGPWRELGGDRLDESPGTPRW